MAAPGGYTEKDSKDDTDVTDREQSEAWHAARDDYRDNYGPMDIGTPAGDAAAQDAFDTVNASDYAPGNFTYDDSDD